MKLTIITINLNNRDGLRRTMDSVVNQTCQDFEYVVIDGGSTDGSREVIMEHQDRLAYWCSEPDRGIYNAMNKGVAHATGDYCLFLNSGDYLWGTQVITNILPHLDLDYDILYGTIVYETIDGTIKQMEKLFMKDVNSVFLLNSTIPHPASFIKREALKTCPYDEQFRIVSDNKFWLESYFKKNCSFHFVDIIIACFLLNGLSSTNSSLLIKESKEMHSQILPLRLWEDMRKLDPELYYLWASIPNSYRFKKLLLGALRLIIKLYSFFRITKQTKYSN